MTSKKRVAVLLADGFEEIEAVTVIDVLRRADADVAVLGVAGRQPKGSHGIALTADGLLSEHAGEVFDVVVLPGGMPGAQHLRDDARVKAFVLAHKARGATLAAICAAPMALGAFGVLQGKRATSFPGFEQHLAGAHVAEDPVVVDGDVVTSRGPGTALAFALALVEKLQDRAAADALAARMLVPAGAR